MARRVTTPFGPSAFWPFITYITDITYITAERKSRGLKPNRFPRIITSIASAETQARCQIDLNALAVTAEPVADRMALRFEQLDRVG